MNIIITIIAFMSMAAVGWITWRLVSMQDEPERTDEGPDGEAERSASDANGRDA